MASHDPAPQRKTLRVLHLEDSELDHELAMAHLRRAGHLLVDRTNPGASIFKKMRRLVTQGASLIVFPEGSRTRDGLVGRFKGGVFLLAIESGLPVVPISTLTGRLRLVEVPSPSSVR